MLPCASYSDQPYPEIPHDGSLQYPLKAGCRQSSFLLGLSMALAGLIILPGTVWVVENQAALGESRWTDLLFPSIPPSPPSICAQACDLSRAGYLLLAGMMTVKIVPFPN